MVCGRYTHVLADTLRSIAVLVAAFVAMCTPVNPDTADAAAAVAVSAVILGSVAPLAAALRGAAGEYRVARAEHKRSGGGLEAPEPGRSPTWNLLKSGGSKEEERAREALEERAGTLMGGLGGRSAEEGEECA
jgi:hypothetical protein